MLRQQSILLVYLLIGVYINKRGIVSRAARSDINDMVVRVLLPCMVFESFNTEMTLDKLLAASSILVFAVGIILLGMLAGKLLFGRLPTGHRQVMQYGAIVSNAGFVGQPQVRILYGELGFFYASAFLLPLRITMWTAGVSLYVESDFKTKLKNALTNPNIVAALLGLARMLAGVRLPAFLDTALTHAGDASATIVMMLIGMVLADVPLKTILERDVLVLAAVRLVLLPAVVLMATRFLTDDPVVAGVCVVLTAMPVGANTALVAHKYGSDPEFASKCVVATTLLSLFTIPVFTLFL